MNTVTQNGVSREVLVGVTGGIAAYKTAMLVSRLVGSGFGVSVVMTKSATQLIAPKTFEALTNRSVHCETFDGASSHLHIELARAAKVFCIAPATANILAKAANGIADDLVSTLCLSFDGTLLFAPAMNSVMWQKPSVQRNLKHLKEDGAKIIEPNTGRLSCGETGIGRMAEPETIFETIAGYFINSKE
ncbi:MAG: phosphopantothenoylcysteine decarboxylase [Planctomycetaceae bacterium]|jgi:phosphopantothenoylcysteine decarboxylase/phosphopantothenate--cysteine ligase|nr:phosphopantothenoylcysteine decarboxylase [Planctomycetaceae bacterium]